MCSHSLELKILRLLVLRARVPNINKAIKTGADIRVVGWTITISKDINYTAEGFIEILDRKRSTSSGL